MAFSMNGNAGGSGGRGRFRGSPMLSDINIIPLVDVVMVLLIIFMLTAHVMEFGLEVDVPKVRTVKESAQELPVVNITRDGELYLSDKPVKLFELAGTLRSHYRVDRGVYVRADKDVVWNVMAQVVSTLGDAGLKINMVTQPEDAADKKRR